MAHFEYSVFWSPLHKSLGITSCVN